MAKLLAPPTRAARALKKVGPSELASPTLPARKGISIQLRYSQSRDLTLGSTASVDDSYATAGGTVSQLVVSVAAELALGKVTCFNVLVLKLCRVLLDSEVFVEEVCDGEAHSAGRRWRSESSGENSRKGKKGASASLHDERLSKVAELKRGKSEAAGSDDPLKSRWNV